MSHLPVSGQLWRLPKVQSVSGLSKTEIYRRIRAGAFPRPIELGARASAWSSLAIENWVETLIVRGPR